MDAERMRILEMLQQGRITAEQANRLLQAVEASHRTEPPTGQGSGQEPAAASAADWRGFGRELSERISGRVREALSKRIVGRTLTDLRVGGKGEMQNFTRVRITRSYLSRLEDGTVFHNFGEAVIADDVPEDLLHRKIGAYHNFGRTVGPAPLLRLLEDRGSNFGSFEQPGEEAEEEHDEESAEEATAAAAPARQMHEAVLASETTEDGWEKLVVRCHAGHLDFRGVEGDAFRLVACRPGKRGQSPPPGWEQKLPWSQEQQHSERCFVLGDPHDPSATADLTFRFEIPAEAAITAETGGGDIAAHSLAGELDLRTGGGQISCTDIEGDVKVDSGGGDLSLADIQGTVKATTGGGSISCRDLEGDVTAESGGGNLAFRDIQGAVAGTTGGGQIEVGDVEGDVTVETGGGDLALSDIQGSVRGKTGGGSIRATDLAEDVELETGGGDISCSDIAGSLSANTGSGKVRVADIAGDVAIENGGGDIVCSDVAGSVNATTGSGDIKVSDIAGDAELETGSGDIAMRDVQGEANATTRHGRVTR